MGSVVLWSQAAAGPIVIADREIESAVTWARAQTKQALSGDKVVLDAWCEDFHGDCYADLVGGEVEDADPKDWWPYSDEDDAERDVRFLVSVWNGGADMPNDMQYQAVGSVRFVYAGQDHHSSDGDKPEGEGFNLLYRMLNLGWGEPLGLCGDFVNQCAQCFLFPDGISMTDLGRQYEFLSRKAGLFDDAQYEEFVAPVLRILETMLGKVAV